MPSEFSWLIGQRAAGAEQFTECREWRFRFGPNTDLLTTCRWRITEAGHPVLDRGALGRTSSQDLRLATLAEANRILAGREVLAVTRTGLGGLRIDLGGGVVLEVINAERGEQWAICSSGGRKSVSTHHGPFPGTASDGA